LESDNVSLVLAVKNSILQLPLDVWAWVSQWRYFAGLLVGAKVTNCGWQCLKLGTSW